MRAAVYRAPRRLQVETRPLPALGPEDVLVEVGWCGVCGTDLHMVLEGMGRPDTVGGHEYAGRVAALGSGVRGWGLGERVVGIPQRPCARCRWCRRGRPALCEGRPGFGADDRYEGAFAEYVRVHHGQLLRVPESLPLRVAALAEPLAVALHALTLSGIGPGEGAGVTGAGPLGLLVVAALRAHGVDDVLVSEPHALRRERALAVGATRALAPEALDVPALPWDVHADARRAFFECSGRREAMEGALGRLDRGGTLVLVGAGMARPRFDPNRILLNELVVTGAFTYDADGPLRALGLLASGRLPVEHLVEPEDVPLEGILEALERLHAGAVGAKLMVRPQGIATQEGG
jgi:threonine dehydrogenase-like Zn-dependent dehydrogenase